jgi:hypothetical protein
MDDLEGDGLLAGAAAEPVRSAREGEEDAGAAVPARAGPDASRGSIVVDHGDFFFIPPGALRRGAGIFFSDGGWLFPET